MSRKNIDRPTLWYWILQVLFTRPNFWLFYRKIFIYNRKRVPKKEPLIMVSNHQNALMDALAFASEPGSQRVFLTRADVFNKPLVERFLYSIKMLPIFRIRDGRESLKKNEEIFELAVKIVNTKKCPLFLFPEGNHGDKRRLRSLVKGVFRIAFRAQEKYKNKPGVKILPCGLDYEDYQKYGKSLTVIYGEPIEVSEYWDEFEKNPATGTNLLRERLASEMKKWMINITTDEYYDTYMELREIYRPTLMSKLGLKQRNYLHRFNADKLLIKSLDEILENTPEKLESLKLKTQEYIKIRKKVNLREWVFYKTKYSYISSLLSLLFSILMFPVVLLGIINTLPVFFLPMKLVKKVKDTQFKSTMAYGFGLAIQLIYYPLLITLGFIFLPNIWLKILYIPTIPLSMKAGYNVRRIFIKNRVKLRYNLIRNKNQTLKSAIQLRKELIEELNSVVNFNSINNH